jgi:DNA-binding LacI/PurR family transcriptional regulator
VAVTTVKMPSRAQGRLAVERLVDIIDGRLTDFSGELVSEPPEFIIRDSLLALR